jgi:hypothetical protein
MAIIVQIDIVVEIDIAGLRGCCIRCYAFSGLIVVFEGSFWST